MIEGRITKGQLLTGPPKEITAAVLDLCRRIDPAESPVFLTAEPLPNALENECFQNVAAAIRAGGGEKQHGWLIWEWPRVLLEAEFHCVWRRPDGTLSEVSRRDHDRVLFLPDSSRTYTGVSLDNERMSLADDPLIRKYITVSQQVSRQFLTKATSGQKILIPKALVDRKVALQLALMQRYCTQ